MKLGLPFAAAVAADHGWKFLHAYPKQYVARALGKGQSIEVDGDLSDAAWGEVPFTSTPFEDIAQPLFPNYVLPKEYASRVKVRWDADFLYVGAELGEPFVTGVVTGHNPTLSSPNPIGDVPYYDNDFEVFVDVSGTNYYYKEFEMNYLNATYDVLWRAADTGLGSTGVPCCDDNSCSRWCQNSTYPLFKGTWSMYPRMRTATGRSKTGWVAEIAFPLRGDAAGGGLLDGGANWEQFDPNKGAKYWMMDFSRAEHPFFTSNSSNFGVLCPLVQKTQPTLLGQDQWSCYWEWAWQSVGGHRYMHNPNTWGYVQMASGKETVCRDVQWPARHLLSQIYQLQIAQVQAEGSYTADLLSSVQSHCTLANGCNATTVMQAVTTYSTLFNLQLTVNNNDTSCVLYGVKGSGSAPTGGPCFRASVSMVLDSGDRVQGVIDESRYLNVTSSGTGCLDDQVSWL